MCGLGFRVCGCFGLGFRVLLTRGSLTDSISTGEESDQVSCSDLILIPDRISHTLKGRTQWGIAREMRRCGPPTQVVAVYKGGVSPEGVDWLG